MDRLFELENHIEAIEEQLDQIEYENPDCEDDEEYQGLQRLRSTLVNQLSYLLDQDDR